MISWRVLGLVLLGACGFSSRLGGDDANETTLTITDDSAAELAQGTVVDGVIQATGVIEPDGFVLGGLHAQAAQIALVESTVDYATILAKAQQAGFAGTAFAQVPVDWAADRPHGLGLTSSSTFTVFYDGEILLPAGNVTIEVDADDRALFQIALDRLAFGAELYATSASVATIGFTVPEAGWYPIRAAVTEDTGNARLVMTIVQGPVRTRVDGDRLRARVTTEPGLVVFVFDQQGFVAEHGQVTRPTINEGFGFSAPPYDLTTSFDQFSLRFAGQLRIDAAGTYTFTGDSGNDLTDGFRLWIDGVPVAQRWLGMPAAPSAAVDLTAGWHDLVLDYTDDIGNAEVHLRMAGPDVPAGGLIDPAHLRPVVRRGNTFAMVNPSATTIADGNNTFVTLPLPGDVNTRIDAVDIGFRIDNQDMSTLVLDLFDCAGPKRLASGSVPSYHYYPSDPACAGSLTNAAPPWSLRLADSAIGNGLFIGLGSVRDYGIAALYRGGPRMPFSPLMTYTSAPKPILGAVRIDSAAVTGDLAGASVDISVRTAFDVASLATAPYVRVRDGIRIETAGDILQYQVAISTDGWQYPALDKVEITYVVAGDD